MTWVVMTFASIGLAVVDVWSFNKFVLSENLNKTKIGEQNLGKIKLIPLFKAGQAIRNVELFWIILIQALESEVRFAVC